MMTKTFELFRKNPESLLRGIGENRGIQSARSAVKFARVSSLIAMYLAQSSTRKLAISDRRDRLHYFTYNVGEYSRRALKAMNFDIEVIGLDSQLMRERNFLLVGNHMSYLDVMILASVQPSVFVTSVDMGEAFFLGTMAELGGSIFVERRHRAKITEDTKVMADTLRDGFHVMIYPEGTSGDGQKILPFKKSLLISAVEGQRDILPVVTKYIEIDGEPFGPENCHKVCWYGDMGFAPHFMGVLGLKKVKVELHFLEPIQVTPQSSRHELAEKCRSAIESVYLSDRASRTSAI